MGQPLGGRRARRRRHVEHSVSREAYRAWELERLRSRARACGVGDDELEALVADLYQATKTFTLAAYPEVPGVLAELRDRGLVVAVCSNWDWDLDKAMEQAGLTDAVDVVVTSARAGARKPHPRIFDHTLARCRLEPGEALFVGDTWVPDVEGPLAAGMRPVHVWREDRAHDAGGAAAGRRRGQGPGPDCDPLPGVTGSSPWSDGNAQPGRKLSRTRRCGLSALRSTRTMLCQVPSKTRPPSTGSTTDGPTSAGSRWSAPWPGAPWRWR